MLSIKDPPTVTLSHKITNVNKHLKFLVCQCVLISVTELVILFWGKWRNISNDLDFNQTICPNDVQRHKQRDEYV